MDTATGSGIILATTIEIEGRPVQEYFGIVAGEATASATLAAPQATDATRPGRGRAPTVERRIRKARSRAIAAMAAHAAELGATAVIAIAIDYTNVSSAASGDLLIMVTASGTAVLL